MLVLKSSFPRWTISSSVPGAGKEEDATRASSVLAVGLPVSISTTETSRET
jgi:hypothetical protein